MRKYKQVKEKKVTFDMNEWAEIERRATACHCKTGTYIRNIAVRGDAYFYDMKEAAPVLNGMRIISNNINQIAKKVNETNNLYAEDIEKLKEDHSNLCHTSPKTHSYKTHVNTSFYPPCYQLSI